MALLATSPQNPLVLKGIGDDLIVAGYASVEMVDKQGDLITRGALKNAFEGFMKADLKKGSYKHVKEYDRLEILDAVCADVILVNPPGVVQNHTHEIQTNPPVSTDASVLKEISIGNTKK